MALVSVDSQLLWRNNVAGTPTALLTGNGAQGVFKNDNTMVSDPSSLDPTYLLPIANTNGLSDVCLLEFSGRLVVGGVATAASLIRAELFGHPMRGANVVDGLTVLTDHPLLQAAQALSVVAPMQGDSLGMYVLAGGPTGAVPSIMHGLNTNVFNWPFFNGTVPDNTWFHFVLPIGLMPGGSGQPKISGFEKLWLFLKTVNGSAITGGPPTFIGSLWAHLFEETFKR